MATFRVGVGSFNIKDSAVGIGTETTGHGNLKVEGTIKSTNLDVLGVSTFTRYSGFSANDVSVSNRDLTLSGEYSTTGDIVVEDGASLTVGLGSTACVGSVECISVKHHFSIPVGDTAQRNQISGYGEGTIRYNTDLGTLEFFNGNEWRQFNYTVDVQNSAGRGIFGGGYHPGLSGSNYGAKNIEFFNIATKANSKSFGDLVDAQGLNDAASSSTRMVFSAGYNSTFGGGAVMDIQYITMASEGNATDFGDQTQATYGTGACSNSTRALIIGGNRSPNSAPFNDGNDGNNVICTIEIATIGDAIDFGDLNARRAYPASCGDAVRAVIMGGYNNAVGAGGLSSSDTVVFSSHGNGVDFGSLTEPGALKAGSNSVRGVFAGSNGGSQTFTNVIQYVSLQSLGNATDFGDRTYEGIGAAMSSQTRLVMAGGRGSGTPNSGSNVIDFVEIATTGNAVDFGDAGYLSADSAGSSDCHGGLGGY
tara:strand:+ start:174 stop:1607 length:1434 start_codon:yes stop_codon:yes gene_type:complete